jgi:hypothetical protein
MRLQVLKSQCTRKESISDSVISTVASPRGNVHFSTNMNRACNIYTHPIQKDSSHHLCQVQEMLIALTVNDEMVHRLALFR